jgi:hypothetical protein
MLLSHANPSKYESTEDQPPPVTDRMVCSLPLVARVGLPVSSGFSNRQVSFCKTTGETPVENPAFKQVVFSVLKSFSLFSRIQ